MSQRKRKYHDPDYEDFAVSKPKHPLLSDEEARQKTKERVCAIINKHFATEFRFREEQLSELQVTLSRAQETLAEFRRAVVQHAFSKPDLLAPSQPLTTVLHQPSSEQTRIHPAVKKLLGWGKKTPPPIVASAVGLPMTRRAAATLSTPQFSEATASTSKDTSISWFDADPQDPSTSEGVSKPSTSKVDDITTFPSIPSTSKLKTSLQQSSSGNPALPSRSKTVSQSGCTAESGGGAGESRPATAEVAEAEGRSSVRVPRYVPPSEARGAAKPCRQMRMVGRTLKHLVVGNTSRGLALESRPGRASHKWMLYVRFLDNQSVGCLVRHVVFKLHPSYAPNDVVKVSQPPFHLYRRGWGEFLARVNIHFRHPLDNPVEVTHHLKLDHSGSKVERLGSETHVKVWLHESQTAEDSAAAEAESESEPESDEIEETAPDADESQSGSDHDEAALEDQEAEVDSSEANENSRGAVDIDANPESRAIKQEPASTSPAWPGENHAIVVKEEPLDVPNPAMGLDIFYDDPASFAEEVVEDIIEEVDIKDEPIDEETETTVVDQTTIPIKSEVDVPCEEKPPEKPVQSAVTTSAACGVLSTQTHSLPINPVPNSSVPMVTLPLPRLVPSGSLPSDGNIIIKLVQPGGQVVYMRMCQASNTLTPITAAAQVIRTTGQVVQTAVHTGDVVRTTGQSGQVLINPVQLLRNPGQIVRMPVQVARSPSPLVLAAGQVNRGPSIRTLAPRASGVVVGSTGDGKRLAVNGHVAPQLVVVARPRLNGAAVATTTTTGKDAQRSLLKPLAIREVSIKQEPTDPTVTGPPMPTDPLAGSLTPQESLALRAMIKQEPSLFGPKKRDTSLASQPMGLTFTDATVAHRDAISRALARCSTARCPSMERALATLASAMPLVDVRATRPAFRFVHPYAAQSLKAFLEWPLAKQRASERTRAVALRRLLLTSDRPPTEVWPTRHIQRWLLLHGFTPALADPARQVAARPLRRSYSEPATALAWLDQLSEEEEEEEVEVDELDVDVVGDDEQTPVAHEPTPVVEPDLSHLDTMRMSAEMERRCLLLAETTRKIGVTLPPEVIAGETLYHAAARVVLEAVQLFTEEILRRSLCKAWERNHNRPPSSVEPLDISAAVAQYFPLVSNSGLGKKAATKRRR